MDKVNGFAKRGGGAGNKKARRAGAGKYAAPGNDNDIASNGQPAVENPFTNILFYVAYIVTMIIINGIPFIFMDSISGEKWSRLMYMFCVPYVVIGLAVWSFVKRMNASVALGLLFGFQTPFAAVCLMTGGCGLYMKWV
jgi:hypothetical protein